MLDINGKFPGYFRLLRPDLPENRNDRQISQPAVGILS
jgi:hypothetical protein